MDGIASLYNSMVFAMDVPFYSYGHDMEGVLIEGDHIYVLDSNGIKKEIQDGSRSE